MARKTDPVASVAAHTPAARALTRPAALEPGMQAVVALVLDSLTSDHSRRAYEKALSDFLSWFVATGRPGFSKASVQRYRTVLQGSGLSPSTINQRLSAIRKLAQEASDNGLLDPVLAGGIARVKGVKTTGTRTGNWLTRAQAQALVNAPDCSTLKGQRDRALLAVLVGTGLRRSEICALTIAHLQAREGRWVILDLVGKHRHIRTVPLPAFAKAALDAYLEHAGLRDGHIFRSVRKGDHLSGASITPQGIHHIVTQYAALLGLDVKPHDLRRTFAKLARRGGSALEQIQLTLGHARLDTTQRYLGLQQDLKDAPGDRLGLD